MGLAPQIEIIDDICTLVLAGIALYVRSTDAQPYKSDELPWLAGNQVEVAYDRIWQTMLYRSILFTGVGVILCDCQGNFSDLLSRSIQHTQWQNAH